MVKFSELLYPPESYVVCLYEYDVKHGIRQSTNCEYIFRRCCLERLMDHDQKTCQLCRTPFIYNDLRNAFNGKKKGKRHKEGSNLRLLEAKTLVG
ncbi:hypothetical protein R6Q59_003495 [Mikania micrantha]